MGSLYFYGRSIEPRCITQPRKCNLLSARTAAFGLHASENATRVGATRLFRGTRDCVRTRNNTRANEARTKNAAGLKARKKITNAIERRRSNGRQIFFFLPPCVERSISDARRGIREIQRRATQSGNRIATMRRGAARRQTFRRNARGVASKARELGES